MAAPLTECTKEKQQRFVIRFLWSEGVKTGEVYGRTAVQYGGNYMSQSKVYEWVEGFKVGRSTVEDTPSGWLKTETCVEIKEHLHQHIQDNRRINFDETELIKLTSVMERSVERVTQGRTKNILF
jgi:hypothetical protein